LTLFAIPEPGTESRPPPSHLNMKTAAVSLFSIPFLFAYRASAISGIDCKIKIPIGKERFDFSKLDSPHTVYSIDESSPPAVYNTTWTVNICRPLKVEKSNEKDQCPHGTNSELGVKHSGRRC
jgi:Autophagy-related protein 27